MRNRKGRPRKVGAERQNGLVVRKTEAQIIAETRAVVMEARQRHYGLSFTQAGEPFACSEIGRLYLRSPEDSAEGITRRQILAAHEYAEVRLKYEAAILVKRPRSSSEFDGPGGHDGSEGDDPGYVERCQRARQRFSESRRALLDAAPFAWMAIEAWVTENAPVWSLIGDLRLGLNALAHLYGVDNWEKTDRRAA